MGVFRDILVLLFFFSFTLLCEGSAARNHTNQRVRSFHCVNNQYVFSNWFCDGINDCGDGSDETYGCDTKCGSGFFTCQSDQKCLNITVRCNNRTDCEDNSDEQFCFHETAVDNNCNITSGKFLCHDKLKCIDLSRVCDEETHCLDGSDEGAKCDDYDHEECNHCHHACFRTPDGPHCFYDPETQKYADVHKDILECTPTKNYCDQKCVAYHDVNQCSCEENFTPVYTLFQSFYCEEKEKNRNWLIYTTKGGIRGIQGYNNQTSRLIKETESSITAIAAGNEYVYCGRAYENRQVIEKTSLSEADFGQNLVIVSEGIDRVDAIDVDWRTGNVYFIDNGKSHIAACTNDGKLCIEVVQLSDIGTSIALAPRLGTMFWSMQSEEYGFVIKKADMNGQNAYDFISEGLGNIYSIACDEAAEKLYWLDSSRRKIEMIRLDGGGRKIFKSDLRMEYTSITVNARYLYWNVNNTISTNSAPSNRYIYFSPGTRIIPKIAFNYTDPVFKIYGYSYSEKTTKMLHPCHWGCNGGICLMHVRYFNKTGADCVCANLNDHHTNNWCRNNTEAYLGYNYDYNGHWIDHSEIPRHHPIRIILVCASLLTIVAGVSYFLYRKGCFHGVDVFKHARLY